jgi:hypothetical protein
VSSVEEGRTRFTDIASRVNALHARFTRRLPRVCWWNPAKSLPTKGRMRSPIHVYGGLTRIWNLFGCKDYFTAPNIGPHYLHMEKCGRISLVIGRIYQRRGFISTLLATPEYLHCIKGRFFAGPQTCTQFIIDKIVATNL